jgi:thiol-disulfide isomerase/thioredoxin
MKRFICLLILLLLSCESDKAPKINLKAPQFSLPDLEGNTFSSDSSSSLVVFWATWCKPCLLEIPALNQIHRKYAKHSLKVIGMNVDTPPLEKVHRVAEQYKIEYPVLFPDQQTKDDFGGIKALPTILLIHNGNIEGKWYGSQPKAILEKAIDLKLFPPNANN